MSKLKIIAPLAVILLLGILVIVINKNTSQAPVTNVTTETVNKSASITIEQSPGFGKTWDFMLKLPVGVNIDSSSPSKLVLADRTMTLTINGNLDAGTHKLDKMPEISLTNVASDTHFFRQTDGSYVSEVTNTAGRCESGIAICGVYSIINNLSALCTTQNNSQVGLNTCDQILKDLKVTVR